MVSCVCWIRTGTIEHHRSDSAAVQCFLRMAAYQRSDITSCGPLGVGPRCGMSPGCGRRWGVPGRVAREQCFWGRHSWWDSKKKKRKKKRGTWEAGLVNMSSGRIAKSCFWRAALTQVKKKCKEDWVYGPSVSSIGTGIWLSSSSRIVFTVMLGYGRPFRTLFRDVIFQNVALTREKPYSIQSRKNNVCFLYEVPELISIHTVVSPLFFSCSSEAVVSVCFLFRDVIFSVNSVLHNPIICRQTKY